MKKILTLILVISMVFLISCGEPQESNEKSEDQKEGQKVSVKEVIKGDGWCIKGMDFKSGDTNAEILGLEEYKGKEFCKAKSSTVSEKGGMEITMDSVYYFNKDSSEMWLIAEMSGEMFPEPQISEMHFIDGKPVQE